MDCFLLSVGHLNSAAGRAPKADFSWMHVDLRFSENFQLNSGVGLASMANFGRMRVDCVFFSTGSWPQLRACGFAENECFQTSFRDHEVQLHGDSAAQ